MRPDIRWMLWLAFPFAVTAIWEFARTWPRRSIVLGATIGGALICAIFLGALYLWLAPERQTPKELSIYIACQFGMLPRKADPDRHMHIMVIWSPHSAGNVLSDMFTGDPNGDVGALTPDGKPLTAFTCRTSNYGNEPLVNVSFDLTVTYYQAVSEANGSYQEGQIVSNQKWFLEIPKIDPQPSSPFTFYIVSYCICFAKVFIPDRALATPLGETQPRQIKISNPPTIPLSLWPYLREPFSDPSGYPHAH